MPVSHALKQRLVQQFQQKQQTETLGAQASRATHSDEHPLSSGSKEPAVVQQRPPQPPQPAAPAQLPLPAGALDTPQELEPRHEPIVKASGAGKQQTEQPSKVAEPQKALGKREREQRGTAAAAADGHKNAKAARAAEAPAAPRARPPISADNGAQTRFKKAEPVATTPLEMLDGPDATPRAVGAVAATSCASYSELWTAVRRVCGDSVHRTTARLCYQDSEDDWIALLPDVPFSIFAGSVKRLLVVKKTS